MDTLLQRVVNILIAPPGNLIFHLVLAFSVLASLQAVVIARRSSSFPHAGRIIFGLVMLLAGQMLLFLSSGLAWQGLLNPHVFLPPLDRAVFAFSLVWIVWLWCFSQPARLGDLVTGFLNLLIVILFLFSYTSWSVQATEQSFNNYWIDNIWELAALIIVLTGMGILFFSRPTGWAFGVGMLILSLIGIVAHALLTPNSGDFSGFIRLSQLAAFPLLPNLLHHLTQPGSEMAPAVRRTIKASQPSMAVPIERRRYSSDPRTVQAFLQLKEKEIPEEVGLAVSMAMGHTMFSDLTFIVSGPEYGQVVLHSGYDLIREDEIPGTVFDQSQVPMLAGALQRGKGLRVTSEDSQAAELLTIASALGLNDPGTLLLIPLIINEKPLGGLLLLSPYSKRQWTQEDMTFFASETGRIALILQNAQRRAQEQLSTPFPTAFDLQVQQSMQEEIEQLRTANHNLANGLEDARSELEELRQRVQPVTNTLEVDALVALQKEAQEVISALQAENEQLQAAVGSRSISAVEAGRIEADLRATLKDMAYLQNQLAEANAKILMFERKAAPSALPGLDPVETHDLLVSIVQDLRQPMASITGYTDLLLSESVGILGLLQNKFLERIRASAERMHAMMDDLIQLVVTGEGQVNLLPQPIELGTVVDSAMLDTSAQLREKNITLRVDLPRNMPHLHADRDAIQQIVVHLLQNAGAVTPQEGTVTLRARVQNEAGEDYLLIQVIDSGGGIQPENLSRVFSPRFRADKPLIQGLGDTGIGLSIAKALVEAHGGRIWVDSDTSHTSTFSVLLPMRTNPVNTAVE
jgi:signal transduction histidine kinase